MKDLTLQWAFQQRSTEKFEATPLVVDGVMYLTQAPNDIVAMDAATGELKWIYSYSPAREARPCCGRVNRGVAILGNTLYMATIDAHIVAVDARDGKLVWDHQVANPNAPPYGPAKQSYFGTPKWYRYNRGGLSLIHI